MLDKEGANIVKDVVNMSKRLLTPSLTTRLYLFSLY